MSGSSFTSLIEQLVIALEPAIVDLGLRRWRSSRQNLTRESGRRAAKPSTPG